MAQVTTNYCTIYLARHGETEWNALHRIQGQTDSPLTLNGIKQAKALAKNLRTVVFKAIFSSDLLRAKRTAEMVALDKKLTVITTQALRERAFGRFEGKTGTEFERELKDLFDQRETLADEGRFKFKLHPEIESDAEIITRSLVYLREIAVAYAGKTVLIVSHSGIICGLLIHLGFGTYYELPYTAIDNTAYIKLESDGIDFFVKETFGVHKVKIK